MTEVTRHEQNPECNMLFKALSDRMEQVEKHERDHQDKEIQEIGKILVRFGTLLEVQTDTTNRMMDEFAKNRQENIDLHREKDKMIHKVSDSINEISTNLLAVSKTQQSIIEDIQRLREDTRNDIKSLSDNTKKAIDNQNNKIDDINKRDSISVTDILKKGLANILISVISSGMVVFYLMSKFAQRG